MATQPKFSPEGQKLLPTVTVVTKSGKRVTINEANFDPKQHTLLDEDADSAVEPSTEESSSEEASTPTRRSRRG